MKKILVFIYTILIGINGLAQDSLAIKSDADSAYIEENFSAEKDVIRLVGYFIIPITESEKQKFKDMYAQHGEEMKKTNTVAADDFSSVRQYYLFHTAIVEYKGKTYEADEKGLVSIQDVKTEDLGKILITGRKKSGTVRGGGSDKIEGDRIIFEKPIEVEHTIGDNICVFSQGEFRGME